MRTSTQPRMCDERPHPAAGIACGAFRSDGARLRAFSSWARTLASWAALSASPQGCWQRFGPERVRDAPISEAAIIGAAIGAALVGMRPICEMQFVDFLFVALDQLLHQAALAHYASGGANALPLVIRANYGVGPGSGPQDSGTLYGALLQFPGLTVVIPSSPSEATNLLAQAVRDPNPVLFLEPRELYPTTDLVLDLPALPMTRARVLRQGDDLTCVAAGGMVRKALAAAERVAAEKVSVEVIDLRCVMPLDEFDDHYLGCAHRPRSGAG